MHHLSVSWHVIPLKFSSWNITFVQKEPMKVQIFRFLSVLMKVHPIPHVSFETTRSRFIQILHHCSVSSNIIPFYFFYLKLLYFGQKELIKVEFWDFWVVGRKFNKFMSCSKLQVSFSLNFASLFRVMRDNSSVLF